MPNIKGGRLRIMSVDGSVVRKLLFLLGVSPSEFSRSIDACANSVTRWKLERMGLRSWKRITSLPQIASLMEQSGIVEVYGGRDSKETLDLACERIFVDLTEHETSYELRTLDIDATGCPFIRTTLAPRFCNLALALRTRGWKSVLKP